MDYRNELKFVVSDLELEIIRYRLLPVMQMDAHVKEGIYTIRSVYFDDYHDSCLAENEAGIGERHKYRIRLYDGDTGLIKLEKKSKKQDMTKKAVASIDAERVKAYLGNETPIYDENMSALEKELWAQENMNVMRPKCIVEYERTAFVEKNGNVRITFDRNIRGTMRVQDFLEPVIDARPVLPAGYHVLEVKYDEFLPTYIRQLVDIGTLHRTSFSKYYLSRCHGDIVL